MVSTRSNAYSAAEESTKNCTPTVQPTTKVELHVVPLAQRYFVIITIGFNIYVVEASYFEIEKHFT